MEFHHVGKAFKKKKFSVFSCSKPDCHFFMLLNNSNNSTNFAFFKQSENLLGLSQPVTTGVQQCQF